MYFRCTLKISKYAARISCFAGMMGGVAWYTHNTRIVGTMHVLLGVSILEQYHRARCCVSHPVLSLCHPRLALPSADVLVHCGGSLGAAGTFEAGLEV